MHLVKFDNIRELTFQQLLMMKQDFEYMIQLASDNAQCDAFCYSRMNNNTIYLVDRLEYWENEEYKYDDPESADQADDQIEALTLLIKHIEYAISIESIFNQLK